MASGITTPQPIVDGALFFLRDSDGHRQLRQLESVSVSDESSVSNVPGPAGMIGSTRAAGGFSISVTSRRAKGANPEVRWESLRDADTVFRFEVQFLDSDRHIFATCRVSNANSSVGADGTVTTEATLMCPERQIVTA